MYNFIKQSKVVFIIVLLLPGTQVFAQNAADDELKANVQPITSALERLLKLEPSAYKTDKKKKYGFVAENVQSVFPELVSQKNVSFMFGKNSYRNTMLTSVDEASLIPILVASIKEQQKQLEELKAAIEELKKGK